MTATMATILCKQHFSLLEHPVLQFVQVHAKSTVKVTSVRRFLWVFFFPFSLVDRTGRPTAPMHLVVQLFSKAQVSLFSFFSLKTAVWSLSTSHLWSRTLCSAVLLPLSSSPPSTGHLWSSTACSTVWLPLSSRPPSALHLWSSTACSTVWLSLSSSPPSTADERY